MTYTPYLEIKEFSDGLIRLQPRYMYKSQSDLKSLFGTLIFFLVVQAISIGFLYVGSGSSQTFCKRNLKQIDCMIHEGVVFDVYKKIRQASDVESVQLENKDNSDGDILTHLSLKTSTGNISVLVGASNMNMVGKRKFKNAFREFQKTDEQQTFEFKINKLNVFGFLGFIFFILGMLILIYPILHRFRPAFIEWNSRKKTLRIRPTVFSMTSKEIQFAQIEKIGLRHQGILSEFFVRIKNRPELKIKNWFQIPILEWQKALRPLENLSKINLVIETKAQDSRKTNLSLNTTEPFIIRDGSPQRQKYAAIALVLSVLLWTYLISNALQSGHWDLGFLIFPIFLITTSARLMRQKVTTIDSNSVRHQATGWWINRWSEPLRNYQGIDLVENKDEDTVYRTLVLKHKDSNKSIVLVKTVNKPWEQDLELLSELTARFRVQNLFKNSIPELSAVPREQLQLRLPWAHEWRFVDMGVLIFMGLFFGFIGMMFFGLACSILAKGHWSGIIIMLVSFFPLGVASFLILIPLTGREGILLDEQKIVVHNRILFYRKNVVDVLRADIKNIGFIRKDNHSKKENHAIRITTHQGKEFDIAGHADKKIQQQLLSYLKSWI